jgi:hypothetical protein
MFKEVPAGGAPVRVTTDSHRRGVAGRIAEIRQVGGRDAAAAGGLSPTGSPFRRCTHGHRRNGAGFDGRSGAADGGLRVATFHFPLTLLQHSCLPHKSVV